MVLKDWVLPILIGGIAAFILISILYNNDIKQAFVNNGSFIQLQSSDVNNSHIWTPLENKCNVSITQHNTTKDKITLIDSPIYTNKEGDEHIPVYNYYPKTLIV